MFLPTKKSIWLLLIIISIFLLGACSSVLPTPTSAQIEVPSISQRMDTPVPTATIAALLIETRVAEAENDRILADVVSVTTTGSENAYTFSVEIQSPDIGCDQYANWWEVVTEDGELIYRRILTHSHVNEQPFTRSGGSMAIRADTIVIVRAHMHPDGYGGNAFKGAVNGGFEEIQLDPDFASELENAYPLPDGCAF